MRCENLRNKKVMEANEIRVGNWLIDPRKFNKDTREFFHINENGYFKATARDIQVAELFDPIQLTEEILLKCGFKKKIGYKFVLPNLHFSLVRIDSATREEYAFSHYNLWVNLEYVHQLQNLYFALTGTELEIKL